MASHKLAVCLFVVAVCLLSAVSAGEQRGHVLRKRQIPSNSVAVDAALRNPRFMRRQISCLLAESPCDNIGRSLKQMTPALLRGQCPGCTSSQYQQAMKVMTFVSRQYPEEYSRIYYSYLH